MGIKSLLHNCSGRLKGFCCARLPIASTESLQGLVDNPQLEHLNLSYCKNVSKELFFSLKNNKLQLRHCELDGIGPFHSEVLGFMDNSKKTMTHLSLQSFEFVVFTLPKEKVDNKDFKFLQEFDKLVYLDLGGMKGIAEDTLGHASGSILYFKKVF